MTWRAGAAQLAQGNPAAPASLRPARRLLPHGPLSTPIAGLMIPPRVSCSATTSGLETCSGLQGAFRGCRTGALPARRGLPPRRADALCPGRAAVGALRAIPRSSADGENSLSSASSPPVAALCSVGLGVAATLLLAPAAFASETVPVELFKSFLDGIEALGPLGALAFTAAISLAEMIPLFPTQPFSLAAGLMFGGVKGAGLVLAGNLTAATSAFLLARGVGRSLAEKVIKQEMSEQGEAGAAKSKSMLSNVEEAIEKGGPYAQFVSVLLLRLTPVVPFSASNYLLGLTPLPFLPFFSATAIGMIPWALLFASLGNAGRKLLNRGEDLGSVLESLGEKAGSYTQTALLVGLGILALGAAVWGIKKLTPKAQTSEPVEEVDETKKSYVE
mmetsp:Transcript_33830/g.87750  ORF Transcript_33830/g.87750 Transcript_33830/m.87750 type:complete len:389 (-) Transcript_33830:216-1382(-)